MSSGATGSGLNPSNAPHLILGIHSHADVNSVMSAFAMKSKRLKTDAVSLFTIQDLTTALDVIQKKSTESSASPLYTVPANPQVHKPSAYFDIADVHYEANSDLSAVDISSIHDHQRIQAASTFLSASINRLHDWDFSKSVELAKICLRLSQDEDERDEALNVLAANFAITGEPTRSIDALKKAVEGRWNLALQTNLALIATDLEPALAVSQMSFLIDGARDVVEKLAATRTAIGLWRQTQSAETGSDDEDDFAPLPQQLLQSIYALISHSSISEEDFFDIGMFLARVDGEKFIVSKSIEMSAHANTLCAEVLRLRAKGIFDFLSEVVAITSRDIRNEKPWIQKEVNDLVEMVNSRLSNDDDANNLGVSLGFKFLEQGLDCSNFVRTALRPLLILGIASSFDATDQPSDKFVAWHQEAANAINQNWIKVDEERIAILRSLHSAAGNTLGALYHRALLSEVREIGKMTVSIMQRMTGLMNRFTANKPAIRSMAGEILRHCDRCMNTYNSIIPFVSNKELEANMKQAVKHLQGFRANTERFT
jgi:hypothetical protein